jgi:hypothetical protein
VRECQHAPVAQHLVTLVYSTWLTTLLTDNALSGVHLSILAHWLNWHWKCLHPLQHLQRTEALQDPVAFKFYTSAAAFANEKMICEVVALE